LLRERNEEEKEKRGKEKSSEDETDRAVQTKWMHAGKKTHFSTNVKALPRER